MSDSLKAKYVALQAEARKLCDLPEPTEGETKRTNEVYAEMLSVKAQLSLSNELGITTPEFSSLGAKHDNTVEIDKLTGATEDVTKSSLRGITDKTASALATKGYRDAWWRYAVQAKGSVHYLGAGDLKVLQEGSDGEGGFLVPEDFQEQVIMKKPAPTHILSKVRTFAGSRDNKIWPKVNYTGSDAPTGNIYTNPMRLTDSGEVPPTSTTIAASTPQFGQITIDVQTWMGSIPLSLNITEDAITDVQALLGEFFRQHAMLAKENSILNGLGVNDNVGVLSLANGSIGNLPQLNVQTFSRSASVPGQALGDLLVSLPELLPPQYEDSTSCAFVFNKQNTGNYIRKIKDSQNRYLFGYGYEDSGISVKKPTEVAGFPFVYSSFVPNVTTTNGGSTLAAAGTNICVFGDWSGYYFVDRVAFSLKVLDQTLYTQNQIQLVSRIRYGGAPAEEWKFYVGQVAA